MKRSKAHNVYLSRQVLDIMIALKTCAGNSRDLLPSRYDADAPMSRATFNRVTYSVVEQAKKDGLPLEPFTVHDLRRTGSTLLNELGFNSDRVEKCLAHWDGRSSRGVYNKAEYEVQRRHMMQEWSDVVDLRRQRGDVRLPRGVLGPSERSARRLRLQAPNRDSRNDQLVGALDADGKGAGSSSASVRSASSGRPIRRRRRTSRFRACATFTRSPCASSVTRAA